MVSTIIFDLDGTLIDSRPAVVRAALSALAEHNVTITEAELREMFGGGARRFLRHFLERDHGPAYANHHLEDAYVRENELQLSYTDRVELLPSAAELLSKLQRSGYRLALATMSARNIVERVLQHHGLSDYFEVVLTANDVVRGKPDPEILEKVIEHLDVEIVNAMYVGDSDHDMDAATSLGMSFILGDTNIYVQGERRDQLLGKARDCGYPVVSTNELLVICDLVEA